MLFGLFVLFFEQGYWFAFLAGYSILWTLQVELVEERLNKRRYRFSFLRLLFAFYHFLDRLNNKRVQRILVSIIFLIALSAWITETFFLSYLLGVFSFELWFYRFEFLQKFPQVSSVQ